MFQTAFLGMPQTDAVIAGFMCSAHPPCGSLNESV